MLKYLTLSIYCGRILKNHFVITNTVSYLRVTFEGDTFVKFAFHGSSYNQLSEELQFSNIML